ATEEGRSRVYGGIHFSFDVTAGQEVGRQVGDYVFDHVLRPVSDHGDEGDSGKGVDSSAAEAPGRGVVSADANAMVRVLSGSLPAVLATDPGSTSPRREGDVGPGILIGNG